MLIKAEPWIVVLDEQMACDLLLFTEENRTDLAHVHH